MVRAAGGVERGAARAAHARSPPSLSARGRTRALRWQSTTDNERRYDTPIKSPDRSPTASTESSPESPGVMSRALHTRNGSVVKTLLGSFDACDPIEQRVTLELPNGGDEHAPLDTVPNLTAIAARVVGVRRHSPGCLGCGGQVLVRSGATQVHGAGMMHGT